MKSYLTLVVILSCIVPACMGAAEPTGRSEPAGLALVHPGPPPGRKGLFPIAAGRLEILFDPRGVPVTIGAPGIRLDGPGRSRSRTCREETGAVTGGEGREPEEGPAQSLPWSWRKGEEVLKEDPSSWESTYSHDPGRGLSVLFNCYDGRSARLSAIPAGVAHSGTPPSGDSGSSRSIAISVEVSGPPGEIAPSAGGGLRLEVPLASIDSRDLSGMIFLSDDRAWILGDGGDIVSFGQDMETSVFFGPQVLGNHGSRGISLVPGARPEPSSRADGSSLTDGVEPSEERIFRESAGVRSGVWTVGRPWSPSRGRVTAVLHEAPIVSAEAYGLTLKSHLGRPLRDGAGRESSRANLKWSPPAETVPIFCRIPVHGPSREGGGPLDRVGSRESISRLLDACREAGVMAGNRRVAFLAVGTAGPGGGPGFSEAIVVLGGSGTTALKRGPDIFTADEGDLFSSLKVNGLIRSGSESLMISRFPLNQRIPFLSGSGQGTCIGMIWTGKFSIASGVNEMKRPGVSRQGRPPDPTDGKGLTPDIARHIIGLVANGTVFSSGDAGTAGLGAACAVLNGQVPSIDCADIEGAAEKLRFLDYALLFLETHWDFLVEGDPLDSPVNAEPGGVERVLDLTVPALSSEGVIGCGRRSGEEAGFFFFNGGPTSRVLALEFKLPRHEGMGAAAGRGGTVRDGAVWDGASGKGGFRPVKAIGDRPTLRLLCPPGRFATVIFRTSKKDMK